jgi:hypothetical protein
MNKKKYTGILCLLSKPEEANGKRYPFAYDSDIPDDLHTTVRLLPTSDPAALTDASLTELLNGNRHGGRLFADLETIEGHTLAWLTIYLESDSGPDSHGDVNPVRVKIERGPELSLDRARQRPDEPEQGPQAAPVPTPRPLPPLPKPQRQQPRMPGMF